MTPAQDDPATNLKGDAPPCPSRAGRLLTVNGGSSSVKAAVFAPGEPPRRELSVLIERIGLPGTTLTARTPEGESAGRRELDAPTHAEAAGALIDFLHERLGGDAIAGVGHRVVHGGMHLSEHQLVTDELVAELKRTQPLDLAHLPREIALIEAFRAAFPGRPQVACFDTAFHRDLPRVGQLLPIPREYLDSGVRRFGFHGLSFSYLMGRLREEAPREAEGKVILAHLGSGASMAAVDGGRPIDTTMAFTPTAGLMMGTRPGDLDPGLLVYMMRVEKRTPDEMDRFISRRCGLLGVSGSSSDMRDLQARRGDDPAADDAVALFCYQARKWIGALAAAMGGLGTLVFSGGIGEHAAEARAEICVGLGFLGIELDPEKNARGAAVISREGSPATVRVMATDEELVIARAIARLVGPV